MKLIHKAALAAVLVSTCVGGPAFAQAITSNYTAGDIILGFRRAPGSSGQNATTSVMVNVGSALNYRALGGNRTARSNSVNFGNIGTTLSNVFGSTWNASTDLWFGQVAANNGTNINNSGSPVNGDPNTTIYLSARRTTLGTAGSSGSTVSVTGTGLGTIGTTLNTLGPVFDANDVAGIAITPFSTANSWEDSLGGSTAADFSLVFNLENNINVSGVSNGTTFGPVSNIFAMSDFYRAPRFVGSGSYLYTLANGSQTAGTAATGFYLGSFTLDGSGNLSFITIPEPGVASLVAVALGSLVLARRRRAANA